ncbi:NTF2-related export protein 1-like isoform X1 [Dysidea avara]|uniref:NTF2-related export protein 1-like isoform X1 n=1 Tax=Dysidea avara TaxID=196820 RepID=UPI0033170D37
MDFNAKLSESCEAGETFYKLFYEHLDKKRNLMSHFYSDDSVVLWNGNAYTGSSSITSFYQALPSSEHVLHSVDCQPVSEVTGEQSTVIVTCEENWRRLENCQ